MPSRLLPFLRLLVVLFLLGSLSLPSVLAVTQYPERTVRVGFYPMNGFHEYDRYGNPIGYDVDLLNEISPYRNWNYEFVRTETWEEALALLESGAIDLLGGAQNVPMRNTHFDFCDFSTGFTYRAIVTLESSPLTYLDLDGMQNTKIGCVATDVRREGLLLFLERSEVSAEIVYYDTFTKMQSALKAGEISSMCCDMMESSDSYRLLAKFSPSDLYYIVKKGNTALLDELNIAVARLALEKPWMIDSLMKKYYADSYIVPLSRADLDFAASYPIIRVGVMENNQPLSRNDQNNTMCGIIPDILSFLADETGFRFELVPIPTGMAPVPFLKEQNLDMVSGIVQYDKHLTDPNLILSEPFMQSRVSIYAQCGKAFAPGLLLRIATTNGFEFAEDYIGKNYPGFELVLYDTVPDCLNALKQGTVDAFIQNSDTVTPILRKPQYANLEAISTIDVRAPLCFAVPANTDPRLIPTINTAIGLLTDTTLDQIIVNETISRPYELSFSDFWVLYRREFLTIGSFVFLSILTITYALLMKRRNLRIVKESEHRLSNITNNINGGVLTLIPDQGFLITYANNGFLSLIGYSRAEYDTFKPNAVTTYVHPSDLPLLNTIMETEGSDHQVALELRIKHRSQGYIPVLFRGTYSLVGVPLLYCVVMDISAQKHLLEEIETEKDRYRIIIEQSDDIFFDIDTATSSIVCSQKYKEKFGVELSEAVLTHPANHQMRVFPNDVPHVIQLRKDLVEGTRNSSCRVRMCNAMGVYIWCDIHANIVSQPTRPLHIIGKITDVDAEVREHERLTQLSERDALTGLFNKTAFHAALDSFLDDPHMAEQHAALFFIDIDNFKQLNDRLGHIAGDDAIIKIAQTLKLIFRTEDIIGRFGGDEFFIFTQGIPMNILKHKASTVCHSLKMEFGDAIVVPTSASVGVFSFRGTALTRKEILERADEALYDAKQNGKDRYTFYTDER